MARKKKTAENPDTASSQASDILAMSPFVMGARLADMARKSPMAAASDMHGFAIEKSFAALESGTALWMEMTRLSIDSSFGKHATPQSAAEGLASAALKPLSKRVRANAAGKPKKQP